MSLFGTGTQLQCESASACLKGAMVRVLWSILVCPFVSTKGREPSSVDVPLEPLLTNSYETSNSVLAPFLVMETNRNSKGGWIIDYSMRVSSSVDGGPSQGGPFRPGWGLKIQILIFSFFWFLLFVFLFVSLCFFFCF